MRREPFGAIAVALLLYSASARGADAPAAYQINVAHSGVVADASLTPPFFIKWGVTLPAHVSYPLMAEGLVFVTTGDSAINAKATVYALDQGTGQIVWTKPVPHPSPSPFTYPWWSAAAYDNDRVFVIDSAGMMTAFNAADGAIAWSKQLPIQYSFSSAPTAMNGVVYVGGAGSGGTLYAVDELTGNVLATQSVENGDSSSPALSGSAVFVSYACNQDYGFALQTLTPLWHHSTFCEGGGGQTSVYATGRLFTRDFTTGNLILDASSGAVLGSYNASSAPAANASTIWARNGTTLVAEDVSAPATPHTLWSFSGDGQLTGAPIMISTGTGDFVIQGSSSGMMYALTAGGGIPVWTTKIGTGVNNSDLDGFAAGHGLLLVPAGNTLSAFSSNPTGVPTLSRWALLMLALLLSSIAVVALRNR